MRDLHGTAPWWPVEGWFCAVHSSGSARRRTGASRDALILSACLLGAAPVAGCGEDGGNAPPASPEAPIRFAVIGDFGEDGPDEARVADLVKSWNVDFIVTTGDNNYPDGESSTIDANVGKYYADFIGDYKGAYGPGSPDNRFWPCPGNHDWYTPGLGPYLDYFTLPHNERYYDVDLGLVHLFSLDSDTHEPDGVDIASVQAAWLEKKLAASTSCFDLVILHDPPYSSSLHGPTEEVQWPFEEWGVEAVIAGHDHTYERLEVGVTPYFVNGLGGASRSLFFNVQPGSKIRYNEDFGAMLITATSAEIRYAFVTAEGIIIDELTMPARCP